MPKKIMNKSKSYWKHGKANGNGLTVMIIRNKEKKRKAALESLDLSKSDWSKRKKK